MTGNDGVLGNFLGSCGEIVEKSGDRRDVPHFFALRLIHSRAFPRRQTPYLIKYAQCLSSLL
jgi:hypothetical protein